MPSMSLKHKIKLFSHYISDMRFKEIYNMFWVYAFWWNHKLSAFLMNKFLPKLGIDLFPLFLEIEHTTVCNFKCKICLTGDTFVYDRFIKDLKAGDTTLNKIGRLQKINEIFKRDYNGEIVQVNAEGLLPVKLTPEHRVLAIKRKWIESPRPERRYVYVSSPEFIEAKNLTRDHALVFPKLKFKNAWKEKIPLSKDLMRFLGIYLAEGNCSRKPRGNGRNGSIYLYLGRNEKDLIIETIDLINKLFNKKARLSESRTAMKIEFHSVEISDFLQMFGRDAKTKLIPNFMFGLDEEYVKEFITGFIKGDGYINKDYIQLTTSSKILALQFQKILSKLGIFGRIYENKREGESSIEGRKVHINNLYNIRITRPDLNKFGIYEEKNTKQMYGENQDYFFLPIKKLSVSDFHGSVYNLKTEDNTYEANNIVVHNCEHTYWTEKPRNMKFEEFKRIFDQFGRLKWIGLTGIGSSYLNPDFHKIVRYCKSKGTIVELMDHFANFRDEKQIKELLEISPDFQFVSIYGATKKTSDSICVGSDFDTVIKNVKTFVRLKKEMKKKFPILNFHYIVTKKSKDEVFGFLDFIHSLDTEIGEILITPMLHDFKEAKGYSVKLDSEYINKIREKAKEYDIPTTINLTALQEEKGLSRKPAFTYCKEYIMPFVFVTGDISPCCGLNEANQREILKKNSSGNLFHENIRKVWYSPKYKNIRNLIRQGKCPSECKLCPAYQEQ